MNIVRAKEQELPLIVEMKLKLFQESGVSFLLRENAAAQIQETYASLYREDSCCHFIAYDETGEEPCPAAVAGAVIKGGVPFCFFKNPRYGYVIDVYCIPEKRRQGYAAKLMEAVLCWLKSKGIEAVKLQPSEKGRGLYEKLGFHDSGEMEKRLS